MAAKIALALCAQVLFIQSAFSNCAPGISPYGLNLPGGYGLGLGGPGFAPGLAGPGLAGPYGAGCGGVASSGGGFPVTSISPNAPTGLSIFSENAIEGSLSVGGNLPFLGSVALEGVLPSAGAGAVSYGCGNEAIGIVNESPIATGIVGPAAYPPAGPAAYGPASGYGPGLLGAPGCGCGAIY